MKRFFLLLAVCLPLMGMAANSGKLDFIEYKLDNGLHVILQQDHTTPNVIVSVMYHVGSKNEDPNLTGFAHFFEHLMFEGTDNIPRHEYDKYVMNAGGRLNANTAYDRTFYFELLPSNQLALGLWLESERMLHPSILPVGIQTQKDVVCQEMEQTRDNAPYGRLLTETMKHAYTVHPYQHDVIGSEEHIRNASDQDFINFFKKFYIPNNAVLTVVGDFEIEETRKLIRDYFNDIPAGAPVQQPAMNEPAKTEEVRAVTYDNIQLPALVYAYHTPENTSDETYAVMMLNMLLSSGASSRLYSSIVSDQKLALQLSSFPMPLEHPGLSLMFGFLNINVEMADLEAAIDKEVEKLHNELISDRELQKLKNQIELQLLNNTATIAKRAENLCYAYTYKGNTESINHELEKFLSVTKEDIRNVARKYFVKSNRLVLHYLPKEN